MAAFTVHCIFVWVAVVQFRDVHLRFYERIRKEAKISPSLQNDRWGIIRQGPLQKQVG